MQIETCWAALVALSAAMVAPGAVCVVHNPASQSLSASRHIAAAMVSPSSSVPTGQALLPRAWAKATGDGSRVLLFFTHIVLATRSDGGGQ